VISNSSKLLNIESDCRQVRVDFKYTNRHGYGGWVRIGEDCFIRPAGSDLKFKLIEAVNIAIAPKDISFKKSGDVLFYSLIFPPLPSHVTTIDIIEDENDSDSFNFYNIPLKLTHMSIANNKAIIIKKIENIALSLKDTDKTPKSFSDELIKLTEPLKELSDFLKLSDEETAVVSIAVYLTATSDNFCQEDLKRFTNFYAFDFFEINKIIKQLFKKGWIVKSGTLGINKGNRRSEEKLYMVPPKVLETLYQNNSPEIKKKEVDVLQATEYLFKALSDYNHHNEESEELEKLLQEFEDDYADINPFKLALELNLNPHEKLIYYYAVTKLYTGDELVDVDRMLIRFIGNTSEKIIIKRIIQSRLGVLFEKNYLEFVNYEFKTDKILKLSSDAINKIFGENACFLPKEDFSTGICKLITHDSITEKQLFYNAQELQSINTLLEYLEIEKYRSIVKRLEEHKMKTGLTVLLHGYPGTGKTETIYQLARKTQRNILLVNISEIRDKYVGESEKRLKAVFETYKNSCKHFEQIPILLFNESDALIGKRINVNTSVDQMNNAMQNILLQELEDFTGILIATTNLTSNLDDAFERRFLYKIKYAKPTLDAKISIWKNKLNFLTDFEARQLAEEFDFSGGQIENISRKIFLDSILSGRSYSLANTIQICEEELLVAKNNNKIGF
jgi:hypothetical protein